MIQAFVAGLAYALGQVGFGIWPLLFICMVPFWASLDPHRTSTLREALAKGLIFGAAEYGAGYAWLWWLADGFLSGQRAFAVFLWVLYGAWVAVGFGVHAALTWYLWRTSRRPFLPTVSSLVVVQWLQPHLFSAEMGVGLIHAPLLAQTAEIGGPLLLTAWVASVNAAVLMIYSRMSERKTVGTFAHRSAGHAPSALDRRMNADLSGLGASPAFCRQTLYAVGVFSVTVIAFGAYREVQLSASDRDAPALRVGIVQANLSPSADTVERLRAHREYLALSRSLTNKAELDLIVWPESAYGP
ncbi:MAG: hypothetical protein AAFN74_24975, partial [Myxococcota bacterium]